MVEVLATTDTQVARGKCLAYRFLHQPCSQGYRSWEVPIRRQSRRPNHQVFWHQGQGCSEVCPSPAELKTRIFKLP